MNTKKILIVFGTRPEAIKMAPLCHALKSNKNFNISVCVTGQHREMLDQVLKIFDLNPDIDLNLMKKGQSLFEITSGILLSIKKVLVENKPDIVLVHGDTTTTMATAMACFYLGIQIGHIEAGLRTNNINAPFPEEFNRRLVGSVSKIHFAPTIEAKANLINEKVSKDSIFVTGNTVIDSLFWVINKIDSNPLLQNKIHKLLEEKLSFDWRSSQYILITGHRRENFGDGFLNICEAIASAAKKHPRTHFIYPVHLNPNVEKPVIKILSNIHNVHLIEPLEYEPFIYLLKSCYLVLTDSGGIQEEAPSLGKPVLVMREVTERPEAVDAGTVKLVGADKTNIEKYIDKLILDNDYYQAMSSSSNPYGDGNACKRIVKILEEKLNETFI